MPMNPVMRDWQGQRVWLVGASSGIGLALGQALHALGARVAVSARSEAALQAFAATHAGALALPLDVTDAPALKAAAARLQAEFGGLDLVVFCAGTYRAMRAANFDLAQALHHDAVNYQGALHLLDAVLPGLLSAGRGHLAWVSSVAGLRGLPQGLAYGPTKAALSHLAEVLYLDLHPLGVGVSLIHPGFVATPLTAQNEFKMPALISPAEAAQSILKGWAKGDFEIHFPKRFTHVLKVLRLLPDALYFPLVRRFTGL